MSWEQGSFRQNDQFVLLWKLKEKESLSSKGLVRCARVLEADRCKFFQDLMSFLMKYLNWIWSANPLGNWEISPPLLPRGCSHQCYPECLWLYYCMVLEGLPPNVYCKGTISLSQVGLIHVLICFPKAFQSLFHVTGIFKEHLKEHLKKNYFFAALISRAFCCITNEIPTHICPYWSLEFPF